MRVMLCLLLVSATALADVTVIDNKQTITVDCAKDHGAAVTGNNNTLVLKGKCDSLSVSGNKNNIKADSVKQVMVSGNDNNVASAAAESILVSGDRNTVTWTKGISKPKPSIADNGDNNKVSQTK